MRKGNSPNSRNGLDRGVLEPGAFKLDHLHPVKPIWFSKSYNFFTFILEANHYYPRGLIMGKGNSHNPKTESDSGFSLLGAFILDHLHHFKPISFWNFSNFSNFILGSQFLLPQRANNGKREFSQLQNWTRQMVFSAWSIQTWACAAC